MNYYPRNIGDWRVATWNLTKVQRCIYNDLIDTYYDRERPVKAKNIAEEMGCRSEEELAALSYVLDRYFILDEVDGESVFRHERCDEEIAHFHKVVEDAKKAGKASANARAAARVARKMNAEATVVQRPFNAEATPPQPPKTEDRLSSPSGEGGGEATSSQPTPDRSKPSRKCPKNFEVTADMMQWAAEKVPMLTHRDIEVETEKFRDTTFKTAITDWKGAWRNWLRKEQQFREQRGGGRQFPNSAAQVREQERQRVIEGLTGKKNGTSRTSAIDVETRVVGSGEAEPPDEVS